MVPASANMLVGLPLNVEAGIELLSWAAGLAHPNDSIVALHVIDDKREKKDTTDKTKMRRAKAFVISMLGEFAALCQSKQVNLEAKVGQSSSIGKGLIEEVMFLKAHILIVGGSRNRSERSSLDIARYCFKHAPEECSVIAIRKKARPYQETNSGYIPNEGFCKVSLKGSNRENHVGKAISPVPKDSISTTKDTSFNKNMSSRNMHSLTQSINEKPSPITVFDQPEGGMNNIDDYFSFADFSNNECSTPASKLGESNHGIRLHRRSNTWKNLPVIKLLFPFFRSPYAGTRKENDKGLPNKEHLHPSWRCFSYDEISEATKNFHPDNVVGKGGFSEVYKGDLGDGQKIAVKRLSKDSTDEHKEKEFLTELGIIGHVCHPNTSYLIGCCFENGFHLIFNLAPNGSLASALHGKNCTVLEWSVRYKIVIGVARGLHYLHKCCKRRIIHRDIKASNVLLGPNFEPQISDFGLAKWLPTQWTHHSVIPIEGTFGYFKMGQRIVSDTSLLRVKSEILPYPWYLAPEYFMHGIVDEKTDVYSFGVLLLEIITGRRPVDASKENLLFWAKPLIESGKISELADPKLDDKYDKGQAHRLVVIASYCVRQTSIWRPNMSEVLQLITDGHDSELSQSWRLSECKADEVDDYTTDIDCHFLESYSSEDNQ